MVCQCLLLVYLSSGVLLGVSTGVFLVGVCMSLLRCSVLYCASLVIFLYFLLCRCYGVILELLHCAWFDVVTVVAVTYSSNVLPAPGRSCDCMTNIASTPQPGSLFVKVEFVNNLICLCCHTAF